MKRSHIDHFAIADACRAVPGEWRPVGEYNSSVSAQGVVSYVQRASVRRDSHTSAYLPVGAFEARFELTEMGAHVEARYVGPDGLNVEAGLAEILGTRAFEGGGER